MASRMAGFDFRQGHASGQAHTWPEPHPGERVDADRGATETVGVELRTIAQQEAPPGVGFTQGFASTRHQPIISHSTGHRARTGHQ